MKKTLAIIIGSGLLAGCAATRVLEPQHEAMPQMQQKVPGITYEQAVHGYTIYKTKCSGCHRLYQPSEHDAAAWKSILTKMIPKAKITDTTEKGLLRNYLLANAK